MKFLVLHIILVASIIQRANGQVNDVLLKSPKMQTIEILKTGSHVQGLQLAIAHQSPNIPSNDYPVLFIHGSSFPSLLSFGFRMNNVSWMDHLTSNGYDVYALDFLGYGYADRYPTMSDTASQEEPVGRAKDVYKDIDKAVEFISKKTGYDKVYLVGHSWGGSVAALYATKYPGKVAKLVLFAAITAKETASAYEQVKTAFHSITPQQRISAMDKLTPVGKERQLEPAIFESWGDVWKASDPYAVKHNTNEIQFPAGPIQDIIDLQHHQSYYNPKNIQPPTLVIRGEWDQYPNNQDAEKLFSTLENVDDKKYIVISKGTHVLHLEKNRFQLYEEVLHFLQHGRKKMTTNKHAIAVIFEVIPNDDSCKIEYLQIAASLKPELEKIPGFISIERFQSLVHPGKILSLSFWSDESAIQQWRNLEIHRAAQSKGRAYIFKDYHLRIASVIRDYGMFDRVEAPRDSKDVHH
ncbi:alpha-beta hydrolase superfamily lysophospholipase [Chitinophaga skermanii]|uniref:Alpha-beta hydrolase superfamily lysophospholipase n=2 Tax=Chitinophaga skermanii TaxID=331697 RepID=A0A327QYD0_9BACT|nr:alpha-beta hydrolase superfamily lysophospholipase [Chitinophaga skermanii]